MTWLFFWERIRFLLANCPHLLGFALRIRSWLRNTGVVFVAYILRVFFLHLRHFQGWILRWHWIPASLVSCKVAVLIYKYNFATNNLGVNSLCMVIFKGFYQSIPFLPFGIRKIKISEYIYPFKFCSVRNYIIFTVVSENVATIGRFRFVLLSILYVFVICINSTYIFKKSVTALITFIFNSWLSISTSWIP